MPLPRRLIGLGLALAAGLLLSTLLLVALARPAFAPPANPTHPFPGACGATLQACINAASPGDTIQVQPGAYTASLTLNKAVSLTGVSSATVVIRALTFQRVLTVTGAAVNSSVVISGLTLSGGQLLSGCPAACRGAGVLVTGTAQPLFVNVTLSGNVSFGSGGGLYAHAGSPLVLVNSVVRGNLAGLGGGGAYVVGAASLADGRFENNQCTQAGCTGGGLRAGSLALTETDFINNAANGDGGGAWSFGAAHSTGGLFLLNQCTYFAGCHGGGLHAAGALWLTDTTFIANTVVERGGGAHTLGDAVVSGGLFLTNESEASGGGLYVTGRLTMTGAQFINNETGGSGAGGGAYAFIASLTGGLFQQNSASLGGGIAAASLHLTDTHILSNSVSAGGRGGGASVVSAHLLGGLFQGNLAAGTEGGGLHATASLLMTATQFISNTAGQDGGGAWAEEASLTGGLFQGNVSDHGWGGGLFVDDGAAVNGTRFLGNACTGRGGGLFLNAADGAGATVSQAMFQGNRCSSSGASGGGLSSYGVVWVTGTQFISNSATLGGGAYLAGQVTNSLFAANRAQFGPAIYVDGNALLRHNTIASATLASGSAIYVTAGTVTAINNLFSLYTIGLENGGGTLIENANLFDSVILPLSGTITSGGSSLLNGQAAFVNAAGGDFRLSEDSDAIDAGFNAGVSVDAFGNPRPLGLGYDIGFHEFGLGQRLFLPFVRRN